MTDKIYRIKYSGGGISCPMTKEEAEQMMTTRAGELIPDRDGWAGCSPMIIGILAVVLILIYLFL